MKSKDLCKICTEYSADARCEHKKDCELQKILKENNKLRAENHTLRKKNDELETEKSWRDFPDMMGK